LRGKQNLRNATYVIFVRFQFLSFYFVLYIKEMTYFSHLD